MSTRLLSDAISVVLAVITRLEIGALRRGRRLQVGDALLVLGDLRHERRVFLRQLRDARTRRREAVLDRIQPGDEVRDAATIALRCSFVAVISDARLELSRRCLPARTRALASSRLISVTNCVEDITSSIKSLRTLRERIDAERVGVGDRRELLLRFRVAAGDDDRPRAARPE